MIRNNAVIIRTSQQLISRYTSTITNTIEKDYDKIVHVPVMAKEVLEYLNPSNNKIYIDMTFGSGGHSKLLLDSNLNNIKVFGLDRDPNSIETYGNKLKEKYTNFIPLHGKFSELPQLLNDYNIKKGMIDGIIFDFGCSSMQFDEGNRGFSISKNAPLDMRMNNKSNEATAADILASINQDDLSKILRIYGEEKQAKKIARAIIELRHNGIYMKTTNDLSNLVANICGTDHKQDKLQRHAHSATKVFQALRILVNNELNEINYAMIIAYNYLKIGGKMITLTFHSLEDCIVKRHIQGNVFNNVINSEPLKYVDTNKMFDINDINTGWQQINKHVITPTPEEIIINPRSRSAKLRAAIKTN